MKIYLIFGILGICSLQVLTKELPKEFKKCKRGPDFSTCLTAATNDALLILKDGNKELGLPKLEPFRIDSLVFDSTDHGSLNVKQTFKNIDLHNLIKNSKVSKFDVDFEKNISIGDTFNTNLNLVGDYTISGKILLLPIQGSGKFNVTFINLQLLQTAHFEQVMKNGETYLHFTSIESKLKPERMYIHLENLFNGDKALSETMNQVLNENWEDLFKESEPDYSKAFSAISLKLINRVYGQIPLDKIFD